MALLLILCVFGISCNYPDDYVQFRALPQDQQRAQFKQLPPDKQIDYYLYDRSHEPPRMGFEEDIASQGRTILPVLLRRLKAEPEDYRRHHLIWAIEVMHRKYVPLNEDTEVTGTVEDVVGQMKDRDWQNSSRKSLQVILAKPGTPGPQPRVFPNPNR